MYKYKLGCKSYEYNDNNEYEREEKFTNRQLEKIVRDFVLSYGDYNRWIDTFFYENPFDKYLTKLGFKKIKYQGEYHIWGDASVSDWKDKK